MVENEDLTTDTTYVDAERLPPVRHLTHEEAWEMFDGMAKRYAGMSGSDFIRAWDAGEFDDDPERVIVVSMMIDIVRDR